MNSPDVAARFRPVPVVPSFADVRLDESTPEPARSAIYGARDEALAAQATTQLLAFDSGMIVDCSSFVAEHASDRTPTSIGVPAIRRTAVDMAVESILDRVWVALGAVGSQVIDRGLRCAYVRRDGTLQLVALHDLTAIECASVLAGVRL